MSVRILIGDCRERLRDIPDQSVHCVVTSPPYFGLRDYGTGRWEGGDPSHAHDRISARGGRGGSGSPGKQTPGSFPSDFPASSCQCGAAYVDPQVGLEASPDEFVAALVETFREVRRVLRDDGTLWLNIGDSYNNSNKWGGGGANTGKHTRGQDGGVESWKAVRRKWSGVHGIKPKDLMGIPWMLAFALRADGWYLRQDIIWSKPNPMPESVDDRCTKAHEYLFLLSKRQRYFYDSIAIAEESTCDRIRGPAEHGDTASTNGNAGLARRENTGTRNKRSVWTVGSELFDLEFCSACQRSYNQTEYRALKRRKDADDRTIVTCRCGVDDKWLSHFATFPPALILDCIRAGCPALCCSECGAPEVREIERQSIALRPNSDSKRGSSDSASRTAASQPQRGSVARRTETTGFVRTCSHDAPLVPGTVLDPFGGAGTTGMVANREHRDAILLELNPHYAEMTRQRLVRDGGMLVRVEVG